MDSDFKVQRAFEIAAEERKSVAEILAERLVTVERERDEARRELEIKDWTMAEHIRRLGYDVDSLHERLDRAEADAERLAERLAVHDDGFCEVFGKLDRAALSAHEARKRGGG